MRYAVALVLAFCGAGGVAVGDEAQEDPKNRQELTREVRRGAPDWPDCQKTFVRNDWNAAFRACTKAAEKGHAVAQFALGAMYNNGEGVPQDYAEAFYWRSMAAEQGHAGAQAALGAMYFGCACDSVPVNFKMAYFWVNLAATLAEDPERRKRYIEMRDNLMAEQLTPQEVAEVQRMSAEWLEKLQAQQKDD